MAAFSFELVSPARLVHSGAVEQVDVPGVEGDFGVLAGHAPMVALLRPGILTIHADGEQKRMVVFGGFAEVSAQGLTVLADVASPVEDFDRATLTARIAAMEEGIKQMEQGALLDRELQKLDHFKAVNAQLAGAAMH